MRTTKKFLLFLLVIALVATPLCSCNTLFESFLPSRETEATTPTATESTPEVTESTPEVTESTPEVTESTPEVTESTPEVTESTPEVTESTPEVTESTPEETESTPEETESTPEETESTPEETESTPEETESTPEETESTPEESTPEVPEVEDPAADSTLTITDAIALGASKDHNTYTEGKYYVTGVITEVYNTTYGNMKITDGNGNILTIYGTYSADGATRYDKMSVQPVAGDTVTVYGIVGQYNGTPQIKNGWIVAHTAVTPEETTPEETTPDTPAEPAPEEGTVKVVIADYAAANGWVNSTRYESANLNSYISVSVAGTPTGDWGLNSGKYYTNGNAWRIYQNENPAITIAAAEGKTIISVKISYTVDKTGILTLNGNNVETDTVVDVNANSITFSVGNTGTATNGQVRITAIEVVYGNASELPEETTPEVPEETTPEVPEETTPEVPEETTPEVPEVEDPAADSTLTITDAIALGASKDHNTYTEGKYYVTGVITEVYNTTYGNMKITDGNGNILTIYGTYSADGATRYDKMSVQPVAGDTVTIYGIIGQYNGTPQIKNGWIVAHTAVTPEETTPEETTPETPDTPDTPDGESITANKTIADLITEYGWTSSTTKQEFNLDANVTVKINGGSNSGKAYNGNHIRIYATDSPAGTITISVAEGYELVSIKISTETGTYAFLYVDGTTTDICNESVAVSGSSVVLNSVKNGSDGKQVRVTAIEVVYSATGSELPEETTPEETTPEVPEETTPEVPEETTPEVTTPEETTPEETTPETPDTPDTPDGESVTANKTVADLITEYGWTSSTTKQEFNLDANVTVKINGGNNSGKAYNGNHIRIYATDSPAGTITISVAEGYELVSIKISTETGTYAFLYVDGTTTDICNESVAVSGSSVVLNSVKNGSDGKQVRVTAIEVVYA